MYRESLNNLTRTVPFLLNDRIRSRLRHQGAHTYHVMCVHQRSPDDSTEPLYEVVVRLYKYHLDEVVYLRQHEVVAVIQACLANDVPLMDDEQFKQYRLKAELKLNIQTIWHT